MNECTHNFPLLVGDTCPYCEREEAESRLAELVGRLDGLPAKLTTALFQLGGEHGSPVHRIQFMGGKWPDHEVGQGGMNYVALELWITGQIDAILAGYRPK